MKNRGEKKTEAMLKLVSFMFIQYIFLIFQAYLLAICKTKKKRSGFSNFEACSKNVFTLVDYFFSR